jgi:hypothetical protein
MTGAHDSKRSPPSERVYLNVLATVVAELHMEADLRGVPVAKLVRRIVEVVTIENMIDAVLDGELPRKEGAQ